MKGSRKRLLRNFAIEMAVYGILVTVYFLVVLRFLKDPLSDLYQSERVIYAGLALILILAQGVALEWVTSFLIKILGLERLE